MLQVSCCIYCRFLVVFFFAAERLVLSGWAIGITMDLTFASRDLKYKAHVACSFRQRASAFKPV